MDAALTDELRALWARVYGRDPAAAERLRELEAMRVIPARESEVDEFAPLNTDADDAAARTALMDALDSLDESGGSLARASEADAEAEEPAAARHPDETRAHRRRTVAWVASLVATAAVASAVTWGVSEITPVATSSGAPQIATLEPVASTDFSPEEFGGAMDSPVWEFHGLTLFRGGEGWDAGVKNCLWSMVLDEAPDDDATGGGAWGSVGCGAGSFPPL